MLRDDFGKYRRLDAAAEQPSPQAQLHDSCRRRRLYFEDPQPQSPQLESRLGVQRNPRCVLRIWPFSMKLEKELLRWYYMNLKKRRTFE